MKRRALTSLLLLALLAGLGSPLAADYREAFSDGIRQGLDRENWTLLADQMRQAIAEEPQASKKRIKLYGTRFSPYVPHYYLGLALYNLGDSAGALAAWELSQEQGAVAALNKNDRTLLQTRLDELRTQVASQGSPAKPKSEPPEVTISETADPAALVAAGSSADQSLAAAEALAADLDRLATDPLLQPLWASEQSLGPKATQARERLIEAKRAIEQGRGNQDIEALMAAGEQAEAVRRDLAAINEQAGVRRRTLIAERDAESEKAQAADEQAELASSQAAAARELDRARRSLAQIAELATDSDLASVWSTDESLGGRQNKAVDFIEQSQSLLEQGVSNQDLRAFARSQTLAGEALNELAAITRTAPDRKRALQLARQEQEDRESREAEAAMATSDRMKKIRSDLQSLDSKARTTLEKVGAKTPSSTLDALAEELRRQSQAASRLASDASVDRLEQARKSFSTALLALEQGLVAAALPAIGPPAELVAAAEAYFSADYERAAQLLASASFDDPNATLQARLFRAAARYALFLVGGGSDQSLAEAAQADIRDLRQIDSDYEPRGRAFSPRFTEFFAETAASL